jgi:hypothetical protein
MELVGIEFILFFFLLVKALDLSPNGSPKDFRKMFMTSKHKFDISYT